MRDKFLWFVLVPCAAVAGFWLGWQFGWIGCLASVGVGCIVGNLYGYLRYGRH